MGEPMVVGAELDAVLGDLGVAQRVAIVVAGLQLAGEVVIVGGDVVLGGFTGDFGKMTGKNRRLYSQARPTGLHRNRNATGKTKPGAKPSPARKRALGVDLT
jgi:hypothetical protein